jgi:hypothetical protein
MVEQNDQTPKLENQIQVSDTSEIIETKTSEKNGKKSHAILVFFLFLIFFITLYQSSKMVKKIEDVQGASTSAPAVAKKEIKTAEMIEKEQQENRDQIIDYYSNISQWDTSDQDASTNGNIYTAVEFYKKMRKTGIKTFFHPFTWTVGEWKAAKKKNVLKDIYFPNISPCSPSLLTRAPWKYYGKFVWITGNVKFIREFPPKNIFAEILADGGDSSQINIQCEDGTSVCCLMIGSINNITLNSNIELKGLPVGFLEVESFIGYKSVVALVCDYR